MKEIAGFFAPPNIELATWRAHVAKGRTCIGTKHREFRCTKDLNEAARMDFDGHPLGTENDLPFKQKLQGLMGIGVAPNGDVWVADGSDDQLLFFPGGRFKDGKIVKVTGLASPFDIVIDAQNRVWVSNSQSDTIVRFPADDPSKVGTFRLGISVRGLALDQKGNVWVNSLVSPDFPMPKLPPGASPL